MLNEYVGLLVFMLISIILGVIIEVLSYIIGNNIQDTEKLTVFECGFDAFENTKSEFEVEFYLVGLLFIIFDIESSYLYPFIVNLETVGSTGVYGMIDFIVELLVGLVYVLNTGVFKVNKCD